MEDRDSEFLFELTSVANMVTTPFQVYMERGYVHPSYILEKLYKARKLLDNEIKYFEGRKNEIHSENK